MRRNKAALSSGRKFHGRRRKRAKNIRTVDPRAARGGAALRRHCCPPRPWPVRKSPLLSDPPCRRSARDLKQVPCFTARLSNQEAAMARGTMQRSVFIGGDRVVVGAHGIAGTKALPFKGGPENSYKPPCHLDKTAQRALIARG